MHMARTTKAGQVTGFGRCGGSSHNTRTERQKGRGVGGGLRCGTQKEQGGQEDGARKGGRLRCGTIWASGSRRKGTRGEGEGGQWCTKTLR
jgi:hypothetical protein